MKYIISLSLKLFAIGGLCLVSQGIVSGEDLPPDLILIVDSNELDPDSVNIKLQSNRIRFDMVQRIGEEEWGPIIDMFKAKVPDAKEMAKLQDLEALILRRGIAVELFSEKMFYVYYEEYLKSFEGVVTDALRMVLEEEFDEGSGDGGFFFYKRL